MVKWVERKVEIETINWRGQSVVLTGVPALVNEDNGKVRFRPYELAQAEIANLARRYDLEPNDIATLMILYAKPGHYKGGEVFYKYHLQKMLFYLWKELENYGYYESMPRDEFTSAINGPKPINMDDDIARFVEKELVTIKKERWHPDAEKPSKRIILTEKGKKLSSEIWYEIPEPYRKVALDVKARIHPMNPKKIRHIVHQEYPEYRDSYLENDIE